MIDSKCLTQYNYRNFTPKKKETFEKCGMFNEQYISCFEDVELNMCCTLLGLTNYNDGNSVAYHYESQTRGDDPKNMEKLRIDYVKNLLPFVFKNIDKLKKTIKIK